MRGKRGRPQERGVSGQDVRPSGRTWKGRGSSRDRRVRGGEQPQQAPPVPTAEDPMPQTPRQWRAGPGTGVSAEPSFPSVALNPALSALGAVSAPQPERIRREGRKGHPCSPRACPRGSGPCPGALETEKRLGQETSLRDPVTVAENRHTLVQPVECAAASDPPLSAATLGDDEVCVGVHRSPRSGREADSGGGRARGGGRRGTLRALRS